MKICWDNLEKLKYNKEKDYWYKHRKNGKVYYSYINNCQTCNESFLGYINEENKYCSHKCARHSEETKAKIGKASKERIFSEETRNKMSKNAKNRILTEEELQRLRTMNIGRKHLKGSYSERSKNSRGVNHPNWKGGVTKTGITLYDTYSHQLIWCEETRRDPKNYNWLQVKCTYSECEKWFNPTREEVVHRIKSINGIQLGESNFYCSEECKTFCPIYDRSLYRKGEEPSYNRDPVYNEWSTMVKERDNYTCQICGSTDSPEAHHYEGLNENDMMSLDLEMGVTLCHQCHKSAHSKLGCRYIDMTKQNVCNKGV